MCYGYSMLLVSLGCQFAVYVAGRLKCNASFVLTLLELTWEIQWENITILLCNKAKVPLPQA
jgi:hypothetical protein